MTITMSAEDRADFAAAVWERTMRDDEAVHWIYEPGDGTHYEFVMTRLDRRPPVGATECPLRDGSIMRLLPADRWLLASPGWGACLVDLTPGAYIDPSYIGEKFTIGVASAVVIAEFLNMLTGSALVAVLREQYPLVFGDVA